VLNPTGSNRGGGKFCDSFGVGLFGGHGTGGIASSTPG
jgi:hypothetical protein